MYRYWNEATQYYFTRQRENGYAYNCTNGNLFAPQTNMNTLFKLSNVKCKENDVIGVYVDLEEFEMKYSVNDGYVALAFTNIAKDIYEGAVSISNVQ